MRDTSFRHREPKPLRQAREALSGLERMTVLAANHAFRETRGFMRIALATGPWRSRKAH